MDFLISLRFIFISGVFAQKQFYTAILQCAGVVNVAEKSSWAAGQLGSWAVRQLGSLVLLW
ncbi:MAG: hypothetical protein CVV21_01105 [Candidatus Goldiibacteriota bacterium HGW-Goldbacteria-1]|nr:MAG: hypothetical protein CVV21_01105 [Candidatus Goldiibacteriota bacterium HGW-Goldbacteria-1]